MTLPLGKIACQAIKEDCYALLDALPQFIWIIRPDGSVVYANQRWRDYCHLLTQHAGEQEGFAHQQRDDCPRVQDRQRTQPQTGSLSEQEVWLQNLHPEDKERVLALKRQALATGEPYEFEYCLREGRTGAYRWFLSRGCPLCNEAGQIVQGSVAKILKLIKFGHRIAATGAFFQKRRASFARFTVIRFSSRRYFDGLKNFCNTTFQRRSFQTSLIAFFLTEFLETWNR